MAEPRRFYPEFLSTSNTSIAAGATEEIGNFNFQGKLKSINLYIDLDDATGSYDSEVIIIIDGVKTLTKSIKTLYRSTGNGATNPTTDITLGQEINCGYITFHLLTSATKIFWLTLNLECEVSNNVTINIVNADVTNTISIVGGINYLQEI